MVAFKNAAKWVDQEFRALGATRVARTAHIVEYEFPDGSRKVISRSIQHGQAGQIVRDHRAMYEYVRDRHAHGSAHPTRAPKPVIDFTRLVATDHAKARLKEMRRQEIIPISEVTDTLRFPSHVLYSDIHDTWLWVGHRIAVAVKDEPAAQVVTTVLWSSTDLWNAHPRAEKK